VNIRAPGGEPRSEQLGGGEQRPVPLVAQPTIVSLTFDDGLSSQHTLRSMLAQHGMYGTFYVNSGRVGLPGMMTWSQLLDLAANGHEIGGHGVDHVELTTLNQRDARRQVSNDRQALISHGFDVSSFAYPYGSHNASVRSLVRECGYSSARRAWGLCPLGQFPPDCDAWYPDVVEQIPPVDHYATRTVACLRTWSTLSDIRASSGARRPAVVVGLPWSFTTSARALTATATLPARPSLVASWAGSSVGPTMERTC
jgi:peptidoglycan/xylan/chitin deacetylase (PgdA/CDA1 family)